MKTTREIKKLAPWNDPKVKWVCEAHPDKEFEHIIWNWRRFRFIECPGPGMVEDTEENRRKGYFE